MLDLDLVKRVQSRIGWAPEKCDGVLGPITLTAIDSFLEAHGFAASAAASIDPAPAAPAPTAAPNRILRGDGTWPFVVEIDGADLIIRGGIATCFGGSGDPQDDGSTASGVSTKRNPFLEAVSLSMDGRSFTRLSPAEHAALDGSPIPRLPFHTPVEITIGAKTVRFAGSLGGVIDLGPGKHASHGTTDPRKAHVVDLTVAAARRFDPRASATNFESQVDLVRIIGAAQFAPPSAA